MRTTLDIEDDVLDAARALARRERISTGQAVSRLLRAALTGGIDAAPADMAAARSGFRPFAAHDRLVTDDLIDHLRDEAGV